LSTLKAAKEGMKDPPRTKAREIESIHATPIQSVEKLVTRLRIVGPKEVVRKGKARSLERKATHYKPRLRQ
jgi:hypothetical protein